MTQMDRCENRINYGLSAHIKLNQWQFSLDFTLLANL